MTTPARVRHGRLRLSLLGASLSLCGALLACSSKNDAAVKNGSSGAASGSGGDGLAGNGSGGYSTGAGGSSSGSGGKATGGTGSGSGGQGNGSGGNGSGGTLGSGGPAIGERALANTLFSGHSLLDNPIPDYVEAIAVAKAVTLNWEQQNTPGAPIKSHTWGSGNWAGYSTGKNRTGAAKNLLQELSNPTTIPSGEHYDTLLIAERHDPFRTMEYENSPGYLRNYHDRLAEHSDASRTLLYQVWWGIDRAAPQAWIDFTRTEVVMSECIAGKVNLSLEAEGRQRSVAVVPGGLALARAVEAALNDEVPGISGDVTARIDAFFTDDVHLNTYGQYLIAAALYSALFGKTPQGAHAVSAVPTDTATALESIAWDVVAKYYQGDTYLGRSMEDCRTRVAEDVCPLVVELYELGWEPVEARCAFYRDDPTTPYKFPDPDMLPLPN